MGATGHYTDKPARQVIIDELTWTNDGHVRRVIDIAMKGDTAYVAWEVGNPGEPSRVIGVAVEHHTVHCRGSREVITRVNPETSGPYQSECPERILKQLSPIGDWDSSGYAKSWRERCYANLAKCAAAPGDGAMIRFPEPIEFTDGTKADTFRIHKRGRRVLFEPIPVSDNYTRYRIGNWQTREFVVLA